MSVEALLQVFNDHNEVSPGVQAVLIALAWRTPKNQDTTSPTSYADIARLTHQARSTVRDNILKGMGDGQIELVWARPGERSRYRINRGEWFVSASTAELEKALGMVAPEQLDQDGDRTGTDSDRVGIRTPPLPISVPDQYGIRTPSRKEEEEEEPSLFEVRNPELVERLRSQGYVI